MGNNNILIGKEVEKFKDNLGDNNIILTSTDNYGNIILSSAIIGNNIVAKNIGTSTIIGHNIFVDNHSQEIFEVLEQIKKELLYKESENAKKEFYEFEREIKKESPNKEKLKKTWKSFLNLSESIDTITSLYGKIDEWLFS